jgi:hypothetical protein
MKHTIEILKHYDVEGENIVTSPIYSLRVDGLPSPISWESDLSVIQAAAQNLKNTYTRKPVTVIQETIEFEGNDLEQYNNGQPVFPDQRRGTL